MKKQLAFLLGRQHNYLGEEEEGEYSAIISNSTLSENFLALARDLEIMEAKTPEDIYKSSLSDTKGFTANIDSARYIYIYYITNHSTRAYLLFSSFQSIAHSILFYSIPFPVYNRQNLASTFVNAFVNAGFGQDKLMTGASTTADNNNNQQGTNWLYKNKEHGMMSAAASLGMILLWDVDGGLTQLDKFLYSSEDYIKAGALLGGKPTWPIYLNLSIFPYPLIRETNFSSYV